MHACQNVVGSGNQGLIQFFLRFISSLWAACVEVCCQYIWAAKIGEGGVRIGLTTLSTEVCFLLSLHIYTHRRTAPAISAQTAIRDFTSWTSTLSETTSESTGTVVSGETRLGGVVSSKEGSGGTVPVRIMASDTQCRTHIHNEGTMSPPSLNPSTPNEFYHRQDPNTDITTQSTSLHTLVQKLLEYTATQWQDFYHGSEARFLTVLLFQWSW